MSFRRSSLSSFLLVTLMLAASCSSCDDDEVNNNPATNVVDVDGGTDGGNTSPDGGEDPDGGTEPETMVDIESCNTAIAAPTSGLCDVASGTNGYVLLHAGEILGGSTVYENGYVLVDTTDGNGKIACVGCGCADDANAADATVVSCADGVVSPSLINAHDHITFNLSRPQPHGDTRYDHRHQWRRGQDGLPSIDTSPGSDNSREGVLYGELRHIMAGTTTIAGSGGSQGFTRNVDRANLTEGLLGADVDYSTFPLGDASGARFDSGCGGYSPDSNTAQDNVEVYLPHIAEGIDLTARNEFLCASSSEGGGTDLIDGNTSVIHGIGLTTDDIALMAAEGAKLVWSPRSNIDLYGFTARVSTFKRLGVTVALGTDWTASGSMNVLRELKCADYLNSNHFDRTFSDRELWQLSTYNAAVALGVDDEIGVVDAGYFADIAIFDGSARDNYRAVIEADVKDVALVLRGGTPMFGESDLIEALIPAAELEQCEAIDVCGDGMRVCAERDTGLTVSGLQGAVSSNAYDLFFCDAPEDEPSCLPFRSGEFDGNATATDSDGDGISNDADLCPDVFSSVRPMDGTSQLDADDDMAGDDCDICPRSSTTMCEMFDPNDRDSDGIPNMEDNCSQQANTDQSDIDSDGIGDICDPCPEFDNSETLACPATVYEVRDGSKTGTVFIDNVIVTGIGPRGFYLQTPMSSPDFAGVDYSGLYVYNGGTMGLPAPGDLIRIQASVDEFGGEVQLSDVVDITVQSSDNPLPPFTDVATDEVVTGGALSETLRGTLVRLTDVTVTSSNADGPGSDFGEWAVDDGFRVDDELYEVTPRPEPGETFTLLQGVLTFGFGNTKLHPRGPNDVLTGPPGVDGFDDGQVFIGPGLTDASSAPALVLRLTAPSQNPLTVNLSYTGTSASGPASIVVPAGDQTAEVLLTTSSTLGDTTVTADDGTNQASATVTVFDDTTLRGLDSWTAPASLASGTSASVEVRLTVPAASGGTVVTLASNDPVVTVPADVTVPAGALTASFMATAGATSGTASLTASIGASTLTQSVSVTTAPPNCLLISEYIEDAGNKAVELYNCSASTLDLDNFGLCLVSNQNTSCSGSAALDSVMLAPGEVHTMCNGSSDAGITSKCDQQDSSAVNFNGNDRLFVFLDADNDGSFGGSDSIIDAFGNPMVEPASAVWENADYRRCDFTLFDGTGNFDLGIYTKAASFTDYSDYGVAPVEGCP